MDREKHLSSISIFGLGKLGAPLAAAMASRGYEVIGVDSDPRRVDDAKLGKLPLYEPNLSELWNANSTRLTTSGDAHSAVLNSDISFILVPTPSDNTGGFSSRHVIEACRQIGLALRLKRGFHLVVVTSTVMPGALSHHVLPCLEECSGKLCGLDFGVCYSPEFVALGTVIRDFLNPDLVLIGESDSQSGDLLERFFLRVCENRPPVMRMNFINAEIAKIALNSYITTKITFANMLAQLCEESDGANVDVVTSALGRDSRIGSKYFKGATGYGGPCFPRDNLALLAYARMKGLPATLASVTDSENRVQIERLATRALAYLPPSGTVGILGLAYKPDTNVVDESPGFLLAQYLLAQQIYVVAYDPVAMEQPAVSGLSGLVCASSMTECIRQADVVIIPTPWPEFREAGRIVSMQAKRVLAVIDCWRLLNPSDLTGVTYIPVGIG